MEVPTSDFIELYTNEIAMLKQQIEILTQKYEDISNEVGIQISISENEVCNK